LAGEIAESFEFPVGYGERALAGHLGLAAYRAGFPYILQEYVYRYESDHTKHPSEVRRPDLYIQNEKFDCLIELKSVGIALEDYNHLDKEISHKLKEAWEQVQEYPLEEGRYRCALLGLTVWAHIGKWQNLCVDSQSYVRTRFGPWSKFKRDAKLAQWKWGKDILRPSFCCGYFIPYNQACVGEQDALSYPANNGQNGTPFPVGMLWSGLIKPI
jgi:hypothetical protein